VLSAKCDVHCLWGLELYIALSTEDKRRRLGWGHWLIWALSPLLVPALVAVALSMHDEPMEGSKLRFGPNAYHRQQP